MATVGLVGLAASITDVIETALQGEGYSVVQIPLDVDTVRTAARAKLDVLVVDVNPYLNTGALLTDLRNEPQTSHLPLVLLGPALPPEVPQFEVVEQLGRSFDLPELLEAVNRAAAQYGE